MLSLSLASWLMILIFFRSLNISLALNYNNYNNNNNNFINDDVKNNNIEIDNDVYNNYNHNEKNNYKNIDSFNQHDSGDKTSYNSNIALHNISNIPDYERYFYRISATGNFGTDGFVISLIETDKDLIYLKMIENNFFRDQNAMDFF